MQKQYPLSGGAVELAAAVPFFAFLAGGAGAAAAGAMEAFVALFFLGAGAAAAVDPFPYDYVRNKQEWDKFGIQQ
jgi:hypothetical protein